MIFLIKRLLISFTVICLSFSLTVSAADSITVEPKGDFFVFDDAPEKVAEIFGMSLTELQNHCNRNGTVYLAVNPDNSKQIRITKNQTDFSNSVINITNLTDENIIKLIPDIVGISDVKGEIIDLNGQKAVKIVLRSADSGGDYILTEYHTVANRENYVISFYTNAKTDTDYIDSTLQTLECSDFLSDTDSKPQGWHYVILAAALLFAAATVFVVFTIIRDIKKERE